MSARVFIFYALFWICGRLYFLAPTYLETKIIHGVGLHIIILSLIFYIASGVPYSDMKKKVFWGYLFIYELLGFSTYCAVQFNSDHELKGTAWELAVRSGMGMSSVWLGWVENLFIPIFVVFVGYQLYKVMGAFDHSKSVKINGRDIFLVFQYPKNFIGVLLCIFTPIKANTVALYAAGFIYRFSRPDGGIICEKIFPEDVQSKRYFLINTEMPVRPNLIKLKNLKGTPWTIKTNCLTEFQTVIGPLKNHIWRKNGR